MLMQHESLLKLSRSTFESKRQVGFQDITGEAPPTLAEYNTPPSGASGPTIFGALAPPAATPAAPPTAPPVAPAAAPPPAPAAVDVRPIEAIETPVAGDVAEDVDVSPPETEQSGPHVLASEAEQRVALAPQQQDRELLHLS